MHISYFAKGIKQTTPNSTVQPEYVFALMQEGEFRKPIEKIRSLKDKNTQNVLKEQLPYVTWSGTFQSRKASGLIKHSGLICLDFDDIKAGDLAEAYIQLGNPPFVYGKFLSPRGNGFKVIVATDLEGDTDDTRHKLYFDYLFKYYAQHCAQWPVDKSGSDISRACFLSWDYKYVILYEKENIQPLHVDINPLPSTAAERMRVTPTPTPNVQQAAETSTWDNKKINVYQHLQEIATKAAANGIDITGNYTDEWLTIAFALAGTFGEAGRKLFHELSSVNSEYNEKQTDDKYNNALKTTRFTTCAKVFTIAAQYGLWEVKQPVKPTQAAPGSNIPSEPKDYITYYLRDVKGSRNEPTCRHLVQVGNFWHKVVKRDDSGNLIEQKITFNYTHLIKFLAESGYCRMAINMGNGEVISQFIRLRSNIVTMVNIGMIKDYVFDWFAANNVDDDVVEAMHRGIDTYFKIQKIERLPLQYLKFKRDPEDQAFIYFKDCYCLITAEGITSKPYSTLDGVIWANQVIQKEFKLVAPEEYNKSDIARFLSLSITSKDACNPAHEPYTERELTRIQSVCTGIGYMIHGFKNPSNAKAFVITDASIPEDKYQAEGRTGKSLLFKAINKLVPVEFIDGQRYQVDDPKAMSKVKLDTRVILWNDAGPKFEFQKLFHAITETVDLQKLYKDLIEIPFNESPKFAVTTNFVLRGKGGSFDARMFQVELTDFFSPAHTPADYFKHRLFDHWDAPEWDRFHSFMLGCIQTYLKCGLVDFPEPNYHEKKLKSMVPDDFIDFMDESNTDETGRAFVPRNVELEKNELWNIFRKMYPDQFKATNNQLSRWLLNYCEKYKLKINPHKTGSRDRRNGKDFIYLMTPDGPMPPSEDLPF